MSTLLTHAMFPQDLVPASNTLDFGVIAIFPLAILAGPPPAAKI